MEQEGEPDTLELENQSLIVNNIDRGVSMRELVKFGSYLAPIWLMTEVSHYIIVSTECYFACKA